MVSYFEPLHLQDQYDLASEALDMLGLEQNRSETPPDYQSIIGAINPEDRRWLELRREEGIPDRLIIVPALGELSLTELLARGGVDLSSNQTWQTNTRGRYIWGNLANEHHNAGKQPPNWRIGVLLQDVYMPGEKEFILPNEHYEPGLLHPGKTAGQQLRRLKREQIHMLKHGITLQPITASDYVVAKYGYIEALDEVQDVEELDVPANFKELGAGKRGRHIRRELKTVTRFVQYPRANIGSAPHCYDSSNMVGDAFVEPTWSMARRPHIGVRRVLKIAMEAS